LIVAKPEDFFMCSSGYSFWLMITFWIHLTSGLPGVQAASLEGFAGQDEVARRPRDRKLCHINRARQGRPNKKKNKTAKTTTTTTTTTTTWSLGALCDLIQH